MAFPDPKKEAKRLAQERRMEEDMVYYVRFVKKDCGDPVQFFERIDGLVGNPKKDPKTLAQAISAFEYREGVSDWREIADRYECGGYWYG